MILCSPCSLLGSLVQQLAQLLSLPAPVCNNIAELQRAFLLLVSKFGTGQPLVLLLDGVDQIAINNFGREVDRWVPANFPCGVKIILSMVPDKAARVFPVIRKHIFGQPGNHIL